MLSNYWPILIILAIFAFITVRAKKLTLLAGITGLCTGLLVFAGAGYTGVSMVAAFFLLGTGATSWGINIKQNLGLAERDKGRRTAGQVLANAGIAAALGLLVNFYPQRTGLFRVMMAAALASATADTLSSELGNIYGRNFYNITTFKQDKKGLDGVVSFEGTFIGIVGSIVIASVYALGFGFNVHFAEIIISGTIGNLSDSILGATLERKGLLQNNQVNFLNTAIAALVAFLLSLR